MNLGRCVTREEIGQRRRHGRHDRLAVVGLHAIRIADGTWESYHSNQKEKEAAVEAVASLANTPNRRYWQESDIRAVNRYLATVPAGEHNAAINELKELAADEYNIRNEDWLNDVIKRLKDNSIVNGQGLGTGGR